MNKRDIYKAIVIVLDDLEGAKNLTVSAASSYEALKTLAVQINDEATADETRDLADGSNLPIDADGLRQIADDVEVVPYSALLRRAAKLIDHATTRAAEAEALAEASRQQPHRDLAAARAIEEDLRAQLAEAKAEAEDYRGNLVRQVRNHFPDARIVIEFPAPTPDRDQ